MKSEVGVYRFFFVFLVSESSERILLRRVFFIFGEESTCNPLTRCSESASDEAPMNSYTNLKQQVIQGVKPITKQNVRCRAMIQRKRKQVGIQLKYDIILSLDIRSRGLDQ